MVIANFHTGTRLENSSSSSLLQNHDSPTVPDIAVNPVFFDFPFHLKDFNHYSFDPINQCLSLINYICRTAVDYTFFCFFSLASYSWWYEASKGCNQKSGLS